jgi:hypothetical protein
MYNNYIILITNIFLIRMVQSMEKKLPVGTQGKNVWWPQLYCIVYCTGLISFLFLWNFRILK